MEVPLRDDAREVMQAAEREAQRFHHPHVGTEHVLLALIKGKGITADVFAACGVDLETMLGEVERLPQPGSEAELPGKPPHTPGARQVIEHAMEETRRLKHDAVGPEHLLLGLLCQPSEIAGQVLANLGLSLDTTREEVQRLGDQGGPAS